MGIEEHPRIGNHNNNHKNMTLIFSYGTLKRGFSNHTLMQDLISTGDAIFIGSCRTSGKFPLVCGPYRVPFLLNFPGKGAKVWGELYAATEKGLARMDELEGISRGHYERHPTKVMISSSSSASVAAAIRGVCAHDDSDIDEFGDQTKTMMEVEVAVEAYFAHRNYAEEMWRRNGMNGYTIYSEKEARGYVRRKDRPQHLSFLDHIRIFLSSPPQPCECECECD